MSRDMDDGKHPESPKDASGGGHMAPFIPTSMSGGAMSPSPNVSSPMLFNDGAYPTISLLDNIKISEKASNIGLQKQNTNRPSTKFELAFQRRQPKSPKASTSVDIHMLQQVSPRDEKDSRKDSSSVLIPSKSNP